MSGGKLSGDEPKTLTTSATVEKPSSPRAFLVLDFAEIN